MKKKEQELSGASFFLDDLLGLLFSALFSHVHSLIIFGLDSSSSAAKNMYIWAKSRRVFFMPEKESFPRAKPSSPRRVWADIVPRKAPNISQASSLFDQGLWRCCSGH
ncbi:unnamed protein product [Microthlaspi erraticum]|uniref:Uncharacterized protein n=1 Tax=Microthlaspi erraticum TaxID=1685480 RepID=A0A6D2JN27_9BRAS|nr:unnamed protein product [Microthlaspi erraticum]